MVGTKAPDFKAQAIVKGEITDVTLNTFKDRYKVLFFYPLDFTFVCPTELHAFQDSLQEFHERHAEVIGVSVDSVYSHRAWLAQPKNKGGIEGVQYPLISDLHKSISREYGVLNEEEGIAFRGLFIIDKKNIVQSMQVNNLSLGRNTKEVLRLLDALQFVEKHGQVCPANWQPSEPGLDPSEAGVIDYFSK